MAKRKKAAAKKPAAKKAAKKPAAKKAAAKKKPAKERVRNSRSKALRSSAKPPVAVQCFVCGKFGPVCATNEDAEQAARDGGFVLGKKRAVCPNCASLSVELN